MTDYPDPRRGADLFLPLIGLLAVLCMALATAAGPPATGAAAGDSAADTPSSATWVFP